MKVVGLITEYNPFHNGHQYHIEEAKLLTGADKVVVIMSGNFVQRGTPAILDKFTRTEIALNNGVDLVIELPVLYATASAEFFALGAVSTLDKLGIVDFLCFGSESGDITSLCKIADILVDEPFEFSRLLADYMKSGLTFPQARALSLREYLSTTNSSNIRDMEAIETILKSPNNILGIEYIKAIKRLRSNMIPVTLKRKESNYHDKDLSPSLSSATAIRSALNEELFPTSLFNAIPKNAITIMENKYQKSFPIHDADLSLLVKYKLLLETKDSLVNYMDVSSGLESRIYNHISEFTNFSDFSLLLKTKQYTLTRVNRALLHILLNIDNVNFNEIIKKGTVKYARILGFKKDSSFLIRGIRDSGYLIPVLKVADAKFKLDDIGQKLLILDIFSSDVYNSMVYDKYGYKIENDYIHNIIIL